MFPCTSKLYNMNLSKKLLTNYLPLLFTNIVNLFCGNSTENVELLEMCPMIYQNFPKTSSIALILFGLYTICSSVVGFQSSSTFPSLDGGIHVQNKSDPVQRNTQSSCQTSPIFGPGLGPGIFPLWKTHTRFSSDSQHLPYHAFQNLFI